MSMASHRRMSLTYGLVWIDKTVASMIELEDFGRALPFLRKSGIDVVINLNGEFDDASRPGKRTPRGDLHWAMYYSSNRGECIIHRIPIVGSADAATNEQFTRFVEICRAAAENRQRVVLVSPQGDERCAMFGAVWAVASSALFNKKSIRTEKAICDAEDARTNACADRRRGVVFRMSESQITAVAIFAQEFLRRFATWDDDRFSLNHDEEEPCDQLLTKLLHLTSPKERATAVPSVAHKEPVVEDDSVVTREDDELGTFDTVTRYRYLSEEDVHPAFDTIATESKVQEDDGLDPPPPGAIRREGFQWVVHYHSKDGENHYSGMHDSRLEALLAYREQAAYYSTPTRVVPVHKEAHGSPPHDVQSDVKGTERVNTPARLRLEAAFQHMANRRKEEAHRRSPLRS